VVAPKLTVTVPDQYLLKHLQTANKNDWADQVELVVWDMHDAPPAAALNAELALVPHYW
jgi:hypothetical protein